MNLMKKLYRIPIWLFLMVLVFFLADSTRVKADETLPYDTYVYDYYGDVRYTPAAYIPKSIVDGVEWECGSMKNPLDMTISDDGIIYIADTGNNRIIVLDSEFHYLKVITEYEYQGDRVSFNSPSGVATSGDLLYVADTSNRRVIVLDAELNTYKIVENPVSEILGDDFVFEPLKVSVDYAGRVYVIARNVYQGIMAFSSEGSFRGYTGKIEVKLSPYQKLWRKLATKEQRSKQQLYIPTEFTGMEIDDNGFIYATNIDSSGSQSVRRLNPKGEDVIQKGINDRLSGDLSWRYMGDYSGASRIVDVVIRESRIYSIIDSQRGRIFTYDHEGNLLYIFGGIGTQMGTFTNPVAIEYLEDKILVLDTAKNNITIFTSTEYGAYINQAVSYRYEGNESEAVAYWNHVLEQDANNELANLGLGKAYLADGENYTAMRYFLKAKNQHYYSIAYKRNRNDVLKNNLHYFLTGAVVIIMGYIVIKQTVRPRRMSNEEKN